MLCAAFRPPSPRHAASTVEAALRGLNIRELRARAKEDGVGAADLAEAADEDDQKGFLVPKILELVQQQQQQQQAEAAGRSSE